jgi:hypothetical protein
MKDEYFKITEIKINEYEVHLIITNENVDFKYSEIEEYIKMMDRYMISESYLPCHEFQDNGIVYMTQQDLIEKMWVSYLKIKGYMIHIDGRYFYSNLYLRHSGDSESKASYQRATKFKTKEEAESVMKKLPFKNMEVVADTVNGAQDIPN